jgi:hypothetical protein
MVFVCSMQSTSGTRAMPTQLPKIFFEVGIALRLVRSAGTPTMRDVYEYLVIGRLEDDTPFLLQYREGGITYWDCPIRLGEPLRRKILAKLRKEVRRAETPPAYLTTHDFTADATTDVAFAAIEEFRHSVWRGQYLNEREEDYINLNVPFEQKNEAKALGARWDGVRRKWRIKRQVDMSAFARWLPASSVDSQASG